MTFPGVGGIVEGFNLLERSILAKGSILVVSFILVEDSMLVVCSCEGFGKGAFGAFF